MVYVSYAHILFIKTFVPRLDDLWSFSWGFSIERNDVLAVYARVQVISVPLRLGNVMVVIMVMAFIVAAVV